MKKRKQHKRIDRNRFLFGIGSILFGFVGLATILFISAIPNTTKHGGPGGTYTDWYFPGSNYTKLEWSQIYHGADSLPQFDKNGRRFIHYYAFNYSFVSGSGGYGGMQNYMVGSSGWGGRGFLFSIWDSIAANSPYIAVPFNEDGTGWSIRWFNNWVDGRRYDFRIEQGPSGVDSTGKWWGYWVKDSVTGVETFVGEIKMPSAATAFSNHTSAFGENTEWWYTHNQPGHNYTCGDYHQSQGSFSSVRANGSVIPSTTTSHTNLDSDPTLCFVRTESLGGADVKHYLGITDQLITSFTAQPAVIASGATTTLKWESIGATNNGCSIGPANLFQNGAILTGLKGNDTKTTKAIVNSTAAPIIKAVNVACNRLGGGDILTASLDITVNPASPPTISSFTVSPTSVASGSAVTFSWSSADTSGTTPCSIASTSGLTGHSYPSLGASGTKLSSPLTSSTPVTAVFTLTCTGAASTTPASATVSVAVTMPSKTADFNTDGVVCAADYFLFTTYFNAANPNLSNPLLLALAPPTTTYTGADLFTFMTQWGTDYTAGVC